MIDKQTKEKRLTIFWVSMLGIIFGFAGLCLVAATIGWLPAVGILFAIWGNNLSLYVKLATMNEPRKAK